MADLGILVANAFEENVRRRVLYILAFIAILVGVQALYQWGYMGMAWTAGETDMLASMRGDFIVSLLGMMSFFGSVLGLFLGSTGLSSEIKNRTIVPVLSRPVGRGTFFLAKWAGTMGFLTLFCGIGMLPGLVLAFHWQLYPSSLFALGIAEIILSVAVISGVSLALSTVVHPVAAGGAALLILSLPSLTADLVHHPNVLLMFLGLAGRYLAPASMPESLLEAGLTKGLLDPDYGLYVAVLAENAGYALAAVLAGALAFRARELRLR